ncbi:MAG: hypothetical protein Q9162_006382 [Coniocarpon cinnabarinum]
MKTLIDNVAALASEYSEPLSAVYDEETLEDTDHNPSCKEQDQDVPAAEIHDDEQVQDSQYMESVLDDADEKVDMPIAASFADQSPIHQNRLAKSKKKKVKSCVWGGWD